MIAIFCGCFAEGRTPTIYGDGEQTRDYVYVGDVVAANLRAAELRRRAGRSTSAPASRRRCWTWSGRSARSRAARRSSRSTRPARAGEVLRSCLDASRARELLGWEPQVPLADGPRADAARRSARQSARERLDRVALGRERAAALAEAGRAVAQHARERLREGVRRPPPAGSARRRAPRGRRRRAASRRPAARRRAPRRTSAACRRPAAAARRRPRRRRRRRRGRRRSRAPRRAGRRTAAASSPAPTSRRRASGSSAHTRGITSSSRKRRPLRFGS